MKKLRLQWLTLALALMVALLPAMAEQQEVTGPLTMDELHALSQALIERAQTYEGGAINQAEEGFLFEGIGYSLNLSSEDLSLDTVLLGAEINMGSIHEDGLQGPRGIGVSSTLQETLDAYPNDNPMLKGTMTGAVLYISGGLPEGAAIGQVIRDGQEVKLVDHAVYQASGDAVIRQGLQYLIEQDSVVAIRYYGGGDILTAEQAEAEVNAAVQLQEQTNYFAYDTQTPAPFAREDLRFVGLDFLDVSPELAIESLGEAVHEERVEDSTGEELRIMQWEGVEITFVYAEDGTFSRAERITVTAPGLEGPRGLRVGTLLSTAVKRFENPGEPPVASMALYGDAENQQPPYGRLDVEGLEARLYFAIAQDDSVVLFNALFLNDELVEMSASY